MRRFTQWPPSSGWNAADPEFIIRVRPGRDGWTYASASWNQLSTAGNEIRLLWTATARWTGLDATLTDCLRAVLPMVSVCERKLGEKPYEGP